MEYALGLVWVLLTCFAFISCWADGIDDLVERNWLPAIRHIVSGLVIIGWFAIFQATVRSLGK